MSRFGKKSGSIGLGDDVQKVAKMIGADKIAKVYERVTGKPCNCGKRQDWLNNKVKY